MNLKLPLVLLALALIFFAGKAITGTVVMDGCTRAEPCPAELVSVGQLSTAQKISFLGTVVAVGLLAGTVLHYHSRRKSS